MDAAIERFVTAVMGFVAAEGATAKATGERVWSRLREAKAARESSYVQLRTRKSAGGGA